VLVHIKVECSHSIKVVLRVGQRLPLHCSAVGKSLLSGMTIDQLNAVIQERGLPRFTKNTIVSKKALLSECKKIRREGLAFDNEEIEAGLRCIGAPITNGSERVVATISISGPTQRINREKLEFYAMHVKEAAKSISNMLR
jgi:DNA-binding IclR family transcriptional regulator